MRNLPRPAAATLVVGVVVATFVGGLLLALGGNVFVAALLYVVMLAMTGALTYLLAVARR